MKTNTYLSTTASSIIPYQWEEPAVENSLRFDTNTLPFAPPGIDRFIEYLKKSCPINEYGDPAYRTLKQQLAAYEQIPQDMITITNSGDEAIDIVAKAFLNPEDFFVITPPTYEMFAIQCAINNGIPFEVPLDASFDVDTEAILRAAKKSRTKIVFLSNPNNPTGSVVPLSVIETIVSQSDCIVVIDEAYGEFYAKTAVPLVQKYTNLVILKSFSKFAGLAGARIGYLISNPDLSRTFEAIRFPMGVSYLSAKLAEIILSGDRDWIKDQIIMIRSERKKLSKTLSLFGFLVYPSQANFLLVNMGERAKEIVAQLKTKGVLIRDRSTKPRLAGCVRITVRSPKENSALIKKLQELI